MEEGGRMKEKDDQQLLEALQPPLNLKELLIGLYSGNIFFYDNAMFAAGFEQK